MSAPSYQRTATDDQAVSGALRALAGRVMQGESVAPGTIILGAAATINAPARGNARLSRPTQN